MTTFAEAIGWYAGVCNRFPVVDASLQMPGDPMQIVLVKEPESFFAKDDRVVFAPTRGDRALRQNCLQYIAI